MSLATTERNGALHCMCVCEMAHSLFIIHIVWVITGIIAPKTQPAALKTVLSEAGGSHLIGRSLA